jgi:hypothetical protein
VATAGVTLMAPPGPGSLGEVIPPV